MRKMYHINSPERLKELRPLLKSGDVAALATVWTTKLRKDGKTPWDSTIFAIFETGDAGKGRKAWIGRKVNGEIIVNCSLKYNPALQYCEEHLKKLGG